MAEGGDRSDPAGETPDDPAGATPDDPAGERRPLTALGMMSGTSMDGIDVALLRTDGRMAVERGPSLTVPYPAAMRRRIEAGLEDAAAIGRRSDRPGALRELEAEITDRHAAAIELFLASNGLRSAEIDLVGAHGQTVLHRPGGGPNGEALTVQLLSAGSLARATGLRIVHDIRQHDIEAGGEGAPLVPLYHRALARGLLRIAEDEAVAFLNIGGIGNLTFIHADTLIARDTGPGCGLIDQWVQRHGLPYDDGGRIAGEGAVDGAFVAAMLDRPFFGLNAARSLDRNDFRLPAGWSPELSDGARTLARLTAEAVGRSLRHLPDPPDRWIVSGGGARNGAIMADLADVLAPARVDAADALDLDGDAMEAEAWAYLAVRVAKGLNVSEPGTTGRRPLSEDRPKFAGWL